MEPKMNAFFFVSFILIYKMAHFFLRVFLFLSLPFLSFCKQKQSQWVMGYFAVSAALVIHGRKITIAGSMSNNLDNKKNALSAFVAWSSLGF